MTQRKCPQPICMINQPPLESKYKNLPSLNDKIFNEFKELFTRVGKIRKDLKVTQFQSPFKLVQAKGRKVPLHLLAGVNKELIRMETEGHIKKIGKMRRRLLHQPNCDRSKEGRFGQTGIRLQIIKQPNFLN